MCPVNTPLGTGIPGGPGLPTLCSAGWNTQALLLLTDTDEVSRFSRREFPNVHRCFDRAEAGRRSRWRDDHRGLPLQSTTSAHETSYFAAA